MIFNKLRNKFILKFAEMYNQGDNLIDYHFDFLIDYHFDYIIDYIILNVNLVYVEIINNPLLFVAAR